MLNIWNVLAATGATGKGSTSDNGTADPELFAKELNARFKELTSQAEKIQASLQSLAKAFPALSILSDQGTSGSAANSASSTASTGSRSSVTISQDLLAGMGESEDAANAIRSILDMFFSSLNQTGVMDGKAFESNVWRSLNIQSDSARFVDTYRDSSGKTTLAVSSLSLQYNKSVASMFDQLIGGSSSSTSSASSLNSAQSGQNVFSDAWQYSAYFSYASSSFFDSSSLGGASASFGRVQVSAQIMVAIQEMQTQVEGTEIEGEFSWFVMEALGLVDPLVLDLGGEGFNLRAMEDGVQFDMRGEGAAVRTGFIQGDNAFLYLDENGNGIADGVNELFGDGGGFANGFDKLARHDDNGDGVIDENDEIYSKLRLWRDLNGDGVNQESESMTLAEAGVKSIGLGYDRRYESDGKGNVIGERSTFIRADGTTGSIADVWFRAE